MTASDFHSVEALSIAAKSPRDHLKKKARVDFSPDRSYHSPITRRSPKGRVVGCGSPTSQISTMSTSSTNSFDRSIYIPEGGSKWNDLPIIIDGFLKKRKEWRGWDKRWVVLRKDMIQYFKRRGTKS